MKRFHLIFGVLVLITFVLTGQYMDRYQQHLRGMADGPRMLFRSRHIFILLSGLLHLGIGTYWQTRAAAAAKALLLIGSLLITSASVFFIVAFIYEPWLERLQGPYASVAIYSIAAGTLLHVFSGIKRVA